MLRVGEAILLAPIVAATPQLICPLVTGRKLFASQRVIVLGIWQRFVTPGSYGCVYN